MRLGITWGKIDTYVNKIIDDIEISNIEFTKILGVARGGCVPGVMISNRMGIPFDSILWQTRDGASRNEQRLNQIVSGEKALIVDDIYDSGETFQTMHKIIAPWHSVYWAALISKKDDDFLDFCAKPMYDSTDWIDFPWE